MSRTPEARAGCARAVPASHGGIPGCSTGGHFLLRYTVEQVYDIGSTVSYTHLTLPTTERV